MAGSKHTSLFHSLYRAGASCITLFSKDPQNYKENMSCTMVASIWSPKGPFRCLSSSAWRKGRFDLSCKLSMKRSYHIDPFSHSIHSRQILVSEWKHSEISQHPEQEWKMWGRLFYESKDSQLDNVRMPPSSAHLLSRSISQTPGFLFVEHGSGCSY